MQLRKKEAIPLSVQFSVRVEDQVHAKLRVMAAFKDAPLNAIVVEALSEKIKSWESQFGPLPLPPEGTR
jgi:predicted HicB family RNase H-like nuclease